MHAWSMPTRSKSCLDRLALETDPNHETNLSDEIAERISMKSLLKTAIFWGFLGGTAAFAQSDQVIDWSKTHVLSSHTRIVVESSKKLLVQQKEVFVITNDDAKNYGYDALRETDFVKLRNFEAKIYDQDGKELAELKKGDIKESSVSFDAIYREHKTKYYELKHPSLPYRLVKSKEYEIGSAFFWPDWDPQKDIEVLNARLELILEEPVAFDHMEIGDIKPLRKVIDSDGHNRMLWQVDNVAAFRREYKQPKESDFQIGVKFRPRHFELEGFAGTTSSWQDFGQWFFHLSNPQSTLEAPHSKRASFLQIADPAERIRHIYEYLQEKTRYVQIYLGIDGWRPHSVDNIDRVKYGDCKDLSFYMIAMLQQVGIKAYPALALLRDDGWVNPDAPGNQFNHCIAFVPLREDTLWLECTSDFSAYNDPPASIEGVNVLVVKPDGGHLIRTPESPASANRSELTGVAELSRDRSLRFQGSLLYTGNLAMDIRALLRDRNEAKRKDWLASRFSAKAGDARCIDLEIENLTDPDMELKLNFTVSLTYFARKAGSRHIIQPRLYHRVYFDGEDPASRTTPLLNITRYTHKDEVKFKIPASWRLRKADSSERVDSRFGEFSYELTGGEGEYLWRSAFVLDAREVPLDDYADYFDFMTKAKKLSDKKLMLLNSKS